MHSKSKEKKLMKGFPKSIAQCVRLPIFSPRLIACNNHMMMKHPLPK